MNVPGVGPNVGSLQAKMDASKIRPSGGKNN